MGANGAASRPALPQCRALGSTTDTQLLNSLYRIAKYVELCRLNVPISISTQMFFEYYIPYSYSFVLKDLFPNLV